MQTMLDMMKGAEQTPRTHQRLATPRTDPCAITTVATTHLPQRPTWWQTWECMSTSTCIYLTKHPPSQVLTCIHFTHSAEQPRKPPLWRLQPVPPIIPRAVPLDGMESVDDPPFLAEIALALVEQVAVYEHERAGLDLAGHVPGLVVRFARHLAVLAPGREQGAVVVGKLCADAAWFPDEPFRYRSPLPRQASRRLVVDEFGLANGPAGHARDVRGRCDVT